MHPLGVFLLENYVRSYADHFLVVFLPRQYLVDPCRVRSSKNSWKQQLGFICSILLVDEHPFPVRCGSIQRLLRANAAAKEAAHSRSEAMKHDAARKVQAAFRRLAFVRVSNNEMPQPLSSTPGLHGIDHFACSGTLCISLLFHAVDK